MLSVNPIFTGIMNSGFVTIPVGSRSFTINVISGSATVATANGQTLLLAGNVFSMGMPDSKTVLSAPISLWASGVPNKTVVYFNQ